MKRLTSLFLAALLAFAPLAHADLRASSGAFGPATITSGSISGASITSVSGVPYRLLGGAVPFVYAPTGTMANNGAATLGTALSRTVANAWMWLPAGAVAAGVPASASWLFAQCSSTTVCVIFNNTYTSGSTAPPASPTAFVTTGPGAFTGDTGVIIGPTFTIPAGAIGTLGSVHIEFSGSNNNSAGTKQFSAILGTTQFMNFTATTTVTLGAMFDITNQGSASAQMGNVAVNSTSPLGSAPGAIFGLENTANALSVSMRVQRNTATDWAIIERYSVLLLTGNP